MTKTERIKLIRQIKANRALLGLTNGDIASMLGWHTGSVARLLTENPSEEKNFTKETIKILKSNKLI